MLAHPWAANIHMFSAPTTKKKEHFELIFMESSTFLKMSKQKQDMSSAQGLRRPPLKPLPVLLTLNLGHWEHRRKHWPNNGPAPITGCMTDITHFLSSTNLLEDLTSSHRVVHQWRTVCFIELLSQSEDVLLPATYHTGLYDPLCCCCSWWAAPAQVISSHSKLHTDWWPVCPLRLRV